MRKFFYCVRGGGGERPWEERGLIGVLQTHCYNKCVNVNKLAFPRKQSFEF